MYTIPSVIYYTSCTYHMRSKYASPKKYFFFLNDAQIKNWLRKVSVIWRKIRMWRSIRAWTSNGKRWNDPVRTRKSAISMVLKNQHACSTWWLSPHCDKSLRYCGSAILTFIALPTISKKKLFPFENAPHYSLCLRGCHENSLLSASDIIQLGVPDLLVYTVSSNITFCSKGTLQYDLFSLHKITAFWGIAFLFRCFLNGILLIISRLRPITKI